MISSRAGSFDIWKSRRVRYRYPDSLVGLARILSLQRGKRDASRMLSLPLSTICRWTAEPLAPMDGDHLVMIDALVQDCEDHGFQLRRIIREIYAIPERRDSNQDADSDRRQLGDASDGALAHATETSTRPSRARIAADLARHLIHEQYYEKFCSSRFADAHGLSTFHFIRVFRSRFGRSPYHYLMSIRIQHASRLIVESEQPLSCIAAAVGFETVSSLARAYQSVRKVSLSRAYLGKRFRRAR
ncbi:MAG: AraC family transcriptional regulator [Rudaea sp.]